MKFKEIVMQRYATKTFDGRKVPDDKINELLEMIRFAPSGLNIQPWKIKVISDQKIRESLVEATFNQLQIATCSHLLVFCANTAIDEQIEKVKKSLENSRVPDEIKTMMIERAKGMTRNMPSDAKFVWAKCHVFLAIGNAVNGAKSLGLDSCPMSGFDAQAYSRILELPDNLTPTLLCPVGYAADKPIPKVRLPKEEIFF